MKRIIAILLAVALVVGGLGSVAYAEEPVNEVNLNFFTYCVHSTDGDSVTNVSLLATEKVTAAGIHNTDDLSNEAVFKPNDPDPATGPRLTYTPAEGVEVQSFSQQDLIEGPEYGWYVWQPENPIPEDQGREYSANVVPDSSSFEPGFSVIRTLTPTEFTGTGPHTQTLEINTTPAQPMDVLQIMVYIPYDPLLTATISSSPEPGGAGEINWSANNVEIKIPDPAATTYTHNITIDVVLNEGVTSASFKPVMYVIAWHNVSDGSGSTTGTTVTRTMELGTWTWDTTSEEYNWHWNEQLGKEVLFPAFPTIQVNQVGSSFETHYTYGIRDESLELTVPNTTTTQPAWISADLHNSGDGTGDGIFGLSSRGGPILELSDNYPVTDFNQDFWVPGSAYTWDFPVIDEHQGFNAGAGIDLMTEFTTGFSVTRSVDQTSFPSSTGGTQILTLSVTPKEEMDRLEIHGKTHGELDIATYEDVITITSSLGDGINIDFDEHGFNIGVNAPLVDETYQWQITIQIAPVPPEDPAVNVEYMPFIEVRNLDTIDSGSFYGSSLGRESRNLAGDTLGTWEWQADGDDGNYSWWWEERISKAVHLEGYAEIQGNMVNASFETSYTYRTACDFVPNITLEQPTAIHTDLHNQGDGTGQVVVDPILDLVAGESVTVTDVKRSEYLVTPPEGIDYRWQFPNIEEDQGRHTAGMIDQTAEFWTGFSVSRSADPLRLLPEGGTQILTLTVIPEESMQALGINGNTWLDDFNYATIKLVSGEGDINHDDYNFNIHVDGPETREYQWQITIQIAPLPPEFLALEYMPRIQVDNVVSSEGGSFFGPGPLSGRSLALDGNTVLGTWKWQADGAYYWSWNEQVSKGVALEGYAVRAYMDAPTQEAIDQTIDAGQAWLRTQQHGAGAWYWTDPGQENPQESPSVGMTGLAVWSLMHGQVPQTDPAVSAGIEFILSRQNRNPDDAQNYGAISSHGPEVYETAIAILALRATANDDYLDEIALAAGYLARSQNDEGVTYYHPEFFGGSTQITPEHWAYGGWDYGYASVHTDYYAGQEQWEGPPYVRSDLSCTQFAMIGLKAAEQAMVEAGIALTHDTWENLWSKAEGFVTRCQNPDGGFTYQPQHLAGGGGDSYGSMSAAGVWSLRLAGVPVEDDRVQDGLAWLNCHDFYDRNPQGGRQNHYYFLWTAAKAFTMSRQEPILEEGNWYYDYAGYLLANQDESGQWMNPYWGPDPDGDRESHLNRTEYALLILERAVLPPPPGIDLIHIHVDHMKIEFDRNPDRDKIDIEGRFWLEEGESYDLAVDDVRVNIDGAVNITIPAGSFVWDARRTRWNFKSARGVEPKVDMKLDFDKGEWSFKVEHIDASTVNSYDGVHVALVIGDMFTGQNVLMWIPRLEYP